MTCVHCGLGVAFLHVCVRGAGMYWQCRKEEGWKEGLKEERTEGRMEGWMEGWKDGRMEEICFQNRMRF